MMKRIVALLLALSMVLAVTACGEKSGDKKGSSAAGSEQDVVVNKDVKGTIRVGINSQRNSDFLALFEEFQVRYPNVEVEPVLFETSTDDAEKYLSNLKTANKEMPDVMFDDAGPIPNYIQNGWMYPLTEFLADDSDWEKVPENLRENYTYNENVYALPQTIHSNVLIVNEDLVEEMNVDLPEYDWTWDEFTDFLKKCTNSSYSGIEDISQAYNWMPGAMTDGRTIIGYDAETKTFDMEAVRKYVNYYKSLTKGVEATSLRPQNAGSGVSDYEKKFGVAPGELGNNKAFIAGKVACATTGTWSFATWNQRNLEFNWNFYPVPQCAEGRIPIHVDYCWMTTDVKDENLEAAWAFLRFVTYSTEGNLVRLTSYDEDHITDGMQNEYYIPCTSDESVIEKFETLPGVTDSILYIHENISNGYLGDPEKTVPGFERVEYGVIGDVAYNAVTGREDFSAKMADTQTKANAKLKEYLDQFDEKLKKFEKEFADR